MADEPNNPSIATRPNRLQPTPAEAVVRGWRSSLRNQSQQQQQTQPSSSSRSPSRIPQSQPPSRRLNTTQRPPSGVSSNRLSSNPSLLSLEQPLSPATTVASQSRSSLPLQHHNQPPRSPTFASPHFPNSSSASQHPSSSSSSRQRYPSNGANGRHAAQLNRVYEKPRYDAEYDRGNPSKPSASASSSAPALFDPDAPLSTQRLPIQQQQQHSAAVTVNGGGGPIERRRERELREDGTTTSNGGRKPRSKRETVLPQDLGRIKVVKESKESLESVETDFSGRTKSSSGGGGGGKKSRRRRDGDGLDEAAQEDAGAGGRRQLFDPRRDDPTRFNNSATSLPIPPTPIQPQQRKSTADTRSVAGLSIRSYNSVYSANSEFPGEADDAVSINTHNSASGGGGGRLSANDPALANLKRAYREVMDLEKRLQDQHRAALAEEEQSNTKKGASAGVRVHGARNGSNSGKHDDEYWVRLANGHKQLADAHYSFLQLSLDPRLPTSYHALPQKYNIPTRLWQTAFHQLLERMRHAVLASPFTSSDATTGSNSNDANVLDHLIEFIQYAYGHYSQLFEDPTVAVFKSAWIEQLGDLARYRMAVAGLASRVSQLQQQQAQKSQQQSTASLTSTSLQQQQPRDEEDVPPVRREDAASIGIAALNDWDLEEQETWREIARDWYVQGLNESPGMGRLQHHLALLERSKGGYETDELKGLYHYSKSLTAAHPYLSARESILPLFDSEHQSRRTLPEVSKSELFVHLHGMLFTKISLDDFDDCLGRFLERLQEEGWSLGKGTERHIDSAGGGGTLWGDKEWFMLAVVNISSMLQYGAEDGIVKKLTTKETNDKTASSRGGGGGNHHQASRLAAQSKVAPQAIMLNSARQHQAEDQEVQPESDVVKQLAPANPLSVEDDPLPFKLALQLTFQLLSFTLSSPSRLISNARIVNPYLVLILTFISHLSFHPQVFKHLERSIPWETLIEFLNESLPNHFEIRLDSPTKLMSSRGNPLPEDWCVRGMEWCSGRQLFGRGYWRSESKKIPRSGGMGEMLPPPIEGIEGLDGRTGSRSTRVESEMDALKFDLSALEEEEDGEDAIALSESRWRRLAICASWLVRNVPGFDYEQNAKGDGGHKFKISGPLRSKIDRWKKEDEDAKEAERMSRLSLRERGVVNGIDDSEGDEEEESDDEDDEDENDSEAVKELKARRRQLKQVIRSARASRTTSSRKGSRKVSAKTLSLPKVFPGFTVLVFDTNILLASIKLFSELVEAECWTIVVPLAAITELDGLKRNSSPLGIAASEMISYLETTIRTHSRYLKIQTSRGNYLKDLAIRNESIDFASTPSHQDSDYDNDETALFSSDHARNMDDVILRAVSWQKDHFNSRLAIVNPQAIVEKKKVQPETAQVVLVTFDRNLRLKARARGLDAVDEKELKKVLEIALVNG